MINGILYGGAYYLWTLNMKLYSCHPPVT